MRKNIKENERSIKKESNVIKTIIDQHRKHKTIIGMGLRKSVEIDCIYSSLYLKYTKAYAFEGESHDFWELVFVDSGEVSIQSDNDIFVLKQSEFFLHKPNEFHKISANNQLCNIIVVTFNSNSDILYNLTKRGNSTTVMQREMLTEIVMSGKIILSPKCDINNEIACSPSIHDEQAFKNFLELFFLYCFKAPNSKEAKNINHANTLISSITNYLNINIGDKINYKKLTEFTGYSESYISKTFRNRTGKSVFDYLSDLRITKAKELMAMNMYTFQNISDMLGFDTVQYFSYQFKKNTNMAPSQYLKSTKITKLLNPTELNWSNNNDDGIIIVKEGDDH